MKENDAVVSIKIAELARKKGFDGVTDFAYCFDTSKNGYYQNYDPQYFSNSALWDKHFAAPTREQLHKWLMTKGIFITIEVDQTLEPKFCYNIATFAEKTYEWQNYDPSGTALYYKYDQALDEALEQALLLVK